ncbi:hypothetical protein Ahy_A05g025499 [Arachis hypogaea]|uniref:Uncharacterized protein n=1 Tax=Arachis hypogaea TaxID=3818 RepID=A0A445D8U7_ARAHY|nr:hypothetical protein Ahy_A05g025499 [Arachis hypogaea]
MGLDSVGEEVNVDELGDIDWEEDNNDGEEEFEGNYEVNDENDDRDLAGNPAVQNEADAIVSQHSFGVSSFMRTLDLEAMHAPKFPEYANMGEGNVAAEDGKFIVGIEFGSRESVISTIKSYTISRGVDYTVYKSELQTFYAKCKVMGCWEIRRYNGKHTCTTGMISQDHAKYVVTIDGVGIISDYQNSIDAAIDRSNNAWSPPKAWHMFCIRHIGSSFLRRFKTSYLHKLLVNIGYSRTEQEYNKNYQRLKE